MRKRMIGLLCAALLLFGCTGAVWADNTITINGDNNTVIFVDVPEGYWARDDIQYFASQHIVEGYGDGQFKPQDNVTREQFTKMLVLTFQAELESPQQPSFSDVSKDRWSYPYIEVCKEFLTGYANPFGGLPAYHPEEIATREDIAVALVRMIGLTDKDGKDKNYAATKFSDAQEVSPALLPYVSIAAERGLINGYPDGTFQPNGGITRAETVVLLNRATKQAVTDIESELLLEVALLPGNDARNVTLKITTEEGAAVTVDGKRVATSADSNGNYVGTYAYTFTQEGSKTFMVTASKGGKTKRASTSAEYKADAPVLRITSCPATAAEQQVEIAGTIYDGNYPATLTIGGQPVATGTAGTTKNWTYTAQLKEGDNELVFQLTNTAGKSVKETRNIQCQKKAQTTEQAPDVTADNLAYVIASMKRNSFGGEQYKVKVLLSDGTVAEYTVGKLYDAGGRETDDFANVLQDGGVYGFAVKDSQINLRQLPATSTDGTVTFQKTNDTMRFRVADQSLMVGGQTYMAAPEAYFFIRSYRSGDTKYSVVRAGELSANVTSGLKGAWYGVSGGQYVFGVLDLDPNQQEEPAIAIGPVEAAHGVMVGSSSCVVEDGAYMVQFAVGENDGEAMRMIPCETRGEAEQWVVNLAGFRGKMIEYTCDARGYVPSHSQITTVRLSSAGADGWCLAQITASSGTSLFLTLDDGAQVLVEGTRVYGIDASGNYAQYLGKTQVPQSVDGARSALVYQEDGQIMEVYADSSGNSIEGIL